MVVRFMQEHTDVVHNTERKSEKLPQIGGLICKALTVSKALRIKFRTHVLHGILIREM